MDKRRTWRAQEELVVARWNTATERHRVAQLNIANHATTPNEESDEKALKAEAEAARAELDAVRRQVARLKVEFNSGKRY
ncbi:MAG: hypothetical protein O2975_05685 [Proteobacteria bacterium]|nr:hypothetical protein [Pseudomonadota bacterium]